MDEGKRQKRPRRSFTDEFKAGAVRLVLDEGKTIPQVTVVGWALSAANDRHLALRALEQALRRRCPEAGLLHHTDQGSPYASEDYQRALAAHGITCSMSRRGNAHDNAAMESWFSTMTFELGDRFETHAEAKTKLFDYIEVFYNQERRHSTLGYVSPAQFERAARMVQAAA